jgi:glycosyltransferase involved in cell wall biosynthesis
MRILLVAHEYYPQGSGIANVVYSLKNSMTRLGHDVEVCSPIGPDIKVHGTESLIKRTGGLGIAIFWLKVGKLLRDIHPEYDAIYVHNPLLFRHIKSNNIFCVVHTLFYFTFTEADWRNLKKVPYYLVMILLERISFLFLKDKRFIATSPKTVRELRHFNVQGTIPIVYNGHDFSANTAKNLPKNLGYLKLNRNKRLLYVGRLAHKKNLPQMLKVFQRITQLDPDFELTIIPGKDESAAALKMDLKKKGISRVRILEGISHEVLLSIYKYFQFFIMASKYEGFPLVLSEACANGLIPVLSPLEIFKHIRARLGGGLIVDFSKRPEEVAQRIVAFCRKASDADSKQIALISKEIFEWDKIAEEYINAASAKLSPV